MIEHERYDRADHCHKQAVNVEACHTSGSKLIEEEAAHYRADYAQNNVKKHAFASLIDNLAANKSSNQPEYNPSQN